MIKQYGIFQMLYSDLAGIYGGKRTGFSSMNRAMKELGILSIQATTPQGKGRVERAFRTLQGRLVAEFKLNNITTIEEANIYFNTVFKQEFNNKFAVKAKSNITSYKLLETGIDLNEIFTIRKDRIVQNGEVISYRGSLYLVRQKNEETMVKKMIEIREYRDGQMKMFYQEKEIEYELLDERKQAA